MKKMVSIMMTLALVLSMVSASPAVALSLDDIVTTANVDVDTDEVRESADQLSLSDIPDFSAGDVLELQIVPTELAKPLGWEVKEVNFSDDSVFTVLDSDDPKVIAYQEEQDAKTTNTTSNTEDNAEQETTEPENLSIFLEAHKKGQVEINVVLENPLYDGELELATTAASYDRSLTISNKLSQVFGHAAPRPGIHPILPIIPTLPDPDDSTENQQPDVNPNPPVEDNDSNAQPNPNPSPNPDPNPEPEHPSVNPNPPTDQPLPPIIVNPSYPSRPSRPITPTNPSVPDVNDPDEPGTDDPGNSDDPDGPDDSGDSNNPDDPNNPDTPENPDNPDDGSDPSSPGGSDSDGSDSSNPGDSNNPDNPDDGSNPSNPGGSDGSDGEDGSGAPGDGDGGTETPDQPENPDNPDPDTPENPDPDTPENPENPDPENPDPDEPDGPIVIDTTDWVVETSFVYDGQEHRPIINGVPDNVKVSFNSVATTVGQYTCTVSYEVPEGYAPIDDMTFDYEITPATISVSQKYDFITGTVKPVLTGLVEGDIQVSTMVDGEDTDALDSSTTGIHRATTTVAIDESKQENYIIDRDLVVDTIYNVKSNTQWGYFDLQSTVEDGKLTVKITLNDLKIEQTKAASSMVSLEMKVRYDTSRLQYSSLHVGTEWDDAKNVTDNPDAGYDHISVKYGAFGGHPLATSSEVITLVYDLLDPTNDQDIIFSLGGIQLMPNAVTATGDVMDFKYYIGDVSFVVNPSKINTDDIFIDRNPIEDTKYHGDATDQETSDAQHERLEQYIKDNFDLPDTPETPDPDESDPDNPEPSEPDTDTPDPSDPNTPNEGDNEGEGEDDNTGNDTDDGNDGDNGDDDDGEDTGSGDSDTGNKDNSSDTGNGDGDIIDNTTTPGDGDSDENNPDNPDDNDSSKPTTPSQPDSGSTQPESSNPNATDGNADQDSTIPALGDNINEADEEDAEDEGYTGRINDKATSNPAAIPEPPLEISPSSSNDPEPQPKTGGGDDPGASTSTTNRVEPTAQSPSDNNGIVATRSTSSDNDFVVEAV